MAGWHQTVIIGNVGRDPEMRYLQNGTAVCSFSVAVTERWNDRQSQERREKTTWYRVSCWRQLAETANSYVRKGMQIMIVGTVEASAYTNQAGEMVGTLELTARDMQFLGSRGDNMGGGDYDEREEFKPPAASGNVGDIPF